MKKNDPDYFRKPTHAMQYWRQARRITSRLGPITAFQAAQNLHRYNSTNSLSRLLGRFSILMSNSRWTILREGCASISQLLPFSVSHLNIITTQHSIERSSRCPASTESVAEKINRSFSGNMYENLITH
jgi:hypothetical protein